MSEVTIYSHKKLKYDGADMFVKYYSDANNRLEIDSKVFSICYFIYGYEDGDENDFLIEYFYTKRVGNMYKTVIGLPEENSTFTTICHASYDTADLYRWYTANVLTLISMYYGKDVIFTEFTYNSSFMDKCLPLFHTRYDGLGVSALKLINKTVLNRKQRIKTDNKIKELVISQS